MKAGFIALILGVALGFSLSRIGFSSWDQVHGMFTFSDLRLLFSFGTAALLLIGFWWWVRKRRGKPWTERPIHPGTWMGGILFGFGWALAGACPGIVLVQLGEGKLGAVATLLGIFCGNYVYSRVHEKYFSWAQGSCVSE